MTAPEKPSFKPRPVEDPPDHEESSEAAVVPTGRTKGGAVRVLEEEVDRRDR